MLSEAHQGWRELSTEIQLSTAGQLLHAQILIKEGKRREATETLKAIDSKGNLELNRKISQLRSLCNSNVDKDEKAPPIPQSLRRKAESILNSISKGSFDEERISNLLKAIIRHQSFDHYVAHRLLLNYKGTEGVWPLLIRILFPITTKINPRPLIAWRTWLRECPASSRRLLFDAMKTHLAHHPDYRMENWLKRQSEN